MITQFLTKKAARDSVLDFLGIKLSLNKGLLRVVKDPKLKSPWGVKCEDVLNDPDTSDKLRSFILAGLDTQEGFRIERTDESKESTTIDYPYGFVISLFRSGFCVWIVPLSGGFLRRL